MGLKTSGTGRLLRTVCAAALVLSLSPPSADALSLKDAVSVALDSNPEIGEAVENREAHEFELRQARGFLLPTLDLEASIGKRLYDNESRRETGEAHDPLVPKYGELVATQLLYDGGRARAEIDYQASRVDSASLRVLERSEYIALQVVREYLEFLLQAEIVSIAAENLREHRRVTSNVREGIQGGTLTDADLQQAQERVLAAEARLREAEEEMSAARIRFNRLVGVPLTDASYPGSVAAYLPENLDQALGLGRTNNPRIMMADADIDTADAQIAAARADFLPEVVLEGRARAGYDIDGNDDRTKDVLGRVVLRWNLYRGGIKKANEQEQVRRASEQRMIKHRLLRDVEEAVRISWDRRYRQANLAQILRQQANESALLVNSYQEQFSIGQRSLLDVLDAKNTKFNSDVLAKTAEYASVLAEYRLLAATGQLLDTLKLDPPPQSDAYARTEFNVPPTLPAEVYARVPSRQVNSYPIDLLAPIRRR